MVELPDPEVLVDLVGDNIAVLDADGNFRHLNAAVTDLLGFRSDELVGRDAFALAHPDDRARLREAFSAVVSEGTTLEAPLEYRYRTADGGWAWLRTTVSLPEETGIDGYVLISRDVTCEVESQQRLEMIASASSDVFWMFSAGWDELLFINDTIESVFNVPREELERRPTLFLDAVHPDDRPYVERAMKRLSDGESVLIDYRLGSADGVTKWVRVPGEPVTESGEVVAVTGFARDVTDEYRRERQLAVMDTLLRHTIRNDMNIVDGTAERIADRVAAADAFDPEAWDATVADADGADRLDPDALAELGADVREHAETIRRVASNLLSTAEKQRGVIDLLRQRGSPRAVEIAPVVEDALGMVVDDCDGGVDITYRAPGETGIAGDEMATDVPRDADATCPQISVSYPPNAEAFTHTELDYAIAELVENAIEHAQSTPRVRIDVRATDETIAVSIRDNCPPIPVEERYVITDRWEMDDLRHTGGMGLWLVYWVANRSGGGLTFDSHADGNIVTLTVPNATTGTGTDESDETRRSDGPKTSEAERTDAQVRTDGSVPPEPDRRGGAGASGESN